MTNEEKFKTTAERARNFKLFCESRKHGCNECELEDCTLDECRFAWLALEYKEPPREMEDIIKELRELSSVSPMPGALAVGDCISTIYGKPIRWYLGDIANEIEAAWESCLAIEKAKAAGEGYAASNQSVTDCNQLGNVAKMRKALEGVRDWLVVHNAYVDTEREIVKLNAALAEPLRNCDVGTPEEQGKRLAAAIEECYDAITALLRVIDVLEGRQELGNPNKQSEVSDEDND